MPSELYFHSTLWGGDWHSEKSECLVWADPAELQQLVNKRIGFEMNIRKTKREKKHEKYSTSTEHTWNKLFPSRITNQYKKTENAFEYIVRHTFYTPRQVLGLCDAIISSMPYLDKTDSAKKEIQEKQWSGIFQTCVESYTANKEKDFRDLFGKIYRGLEVVLKLFSSRPCIWNRPQILSHFRSQNAILIRSDTCEQHRDLALIEKLQQMGVLGLGVRSINEPYIGITTYDLRFSYLEKHPYRGGWDIAVLSPLFYYVYDIKPIGDLIVVPHKKLLLPNRAEHIIAGYNVEKNC
jgi:hypothetical protein